MDIKAWTICALFMLSCALTGSISKRGQTEDVEYQKLDLNQGSEVADWDVLKQRNVAEEETTENSQVRRKGNCGRKRATKGEGFKPFPPLRSFQHNVYLQHKMQCKWLRETGASASNMSITFNIGITHFGLEICAIYINPTKKDFPLIWIDANLIARDWLSSATTLYIIEKILFSKELQAVRLRRNYRFLVVPNLNPDGYTHTFKTNRHWMKNRRPLDNETQCIGVNLNHNFDAGFKDGNRCLACNDNFAGDMSFSEVETLSVAKVFQKLSPFGMVFSLHSFGQMWMLPFACCINNPQGFLEMKRVADIAVKEILKVNSLKFQVGKGSDLLSGLTSGSLYDWAVLKHNVSYSYNIQLRPATAGQGGYLPDSSHITPSGKEIFAGISAAILNARLS